MLVKTPPSAAHRRSVGAQRPAKKTSAWLPPVNLLGKLTDTGTRPVAMLAETLLLPLIAIGMGLLWNPADPLWSEARFPGTWLAPVILALRYGPLAGLGGACVLLVGWLALNVGRYDAFPQVFFLGGLILVMLVGEFSSLWQARTRRAENTQRYLDQRLEHLVRQHYLLRLSHDRLEQELIGRPMSMRDAISTLQDIGRPGPNAYEDAHEGAQALLRLLAQYCQIEAAALYCLQDNSAASEPVAHIGSATPLTADDPLLLQAVETRKLCHISQALAQGQHSRHLAVAPLLDLGGELYGVLVIDEMPFFSLQEENLQTVNLLLGYYTDGLAVQALSRPILEQLPDCPPNFAFEAQRLSHIQHSTQLPSVIVALEFLPRAVAQDLPAQIQRLKRALDEDWLIEGPQHHVLALLMPLGDESTAEGYIDRLESWSQQKTGQPLESAGVFPHVIALRGSTPLPHLQRLRAMAHA